MMHIRGLVFALLFLPGGARRSMRVESFHRDVQQQSNSLGNGLDASVEVQEGFIPGLLGRGGTRREVVAKSTGAALALAAAVQAASAKAGQFSKIEVFSLVGQPGISSPYQPGGPKSGPDATFGYKKSDGEILAKGYQQDVTREKAAFEVSKKIVTSQGPNIESKTWWLVRDNFRGQAYNMKANMLAINAVLEPEKKKEAKKAYDKFWKEVNDLDFACKKKELALAQAEYKSVLDALTKYEQIAFA